MFLLHFQSYQNIQDTKPVQPFPNHIVHGEKIFLSPDVNLQGNAPEQHCPTNQICIGKRQAAITPPRE